MKKFERVPKRVLPLFLAIVLTVLSVPSAGFTVKAADEEKIRTVISDLTYEISGGSDNNNYDLYKDDPSILANQNGDYLWVTGRLTTEEGEPLPDQSIRVYYSNRNANGYTDENGVFHARIGGSSYFKDGTTWEIYAVQYLSTSKEKNTYDAVPTETEQLTIVKQAAPALEAQAAGAGKSDGSIKVINAAADEAFEYTDEKPNAYAELYNFEGDTASDLSKGTYYVRKTPRLELNGETNTLYLASDYAEAEIAEKALQYYTVTLQKDENAAWRGNSGDSFELREDAYRSLYITPNEGYIVESVSVEPENGATVIYDFQTGEVYIEGLTSDITLIPVVVEKRVPTTIELEYEFLPDGKYDEWNPAARVQFTITVLDQYGDPVPAAKVYYKQDKAEVSATLSRETNTEGQIIFTNSYVLEEDAERGDWNAQFAFDSKFTSALEEQEIHVVLQKKKDLVLYEDQIIGTAPDAEDGRVINVPGNYQIWTGDVHQGAIVVGSGEWVSPVYNEATGYYEFTGLSAGQHVLRASEYADYDNNTFYLASDFADFMIPRGVWTVTIDIESSEHVVFTEKTELAAEPGGTVYVYVEPEEGYEIASYEVDRPSYVSDIRYSEEDGYVIIEGVTGSIILTVKAEKTEEAEEPESEEPEVETEEPEIKEPETDTKEPQTEEDETETKEPVNSPTDATEEHLEDTQNAKSEAPKTGDSYESIVWAMLLVLSLSAMVAISLKKKQTEKENSEV